MVNDPLLALITSRARALVLEALFGLPERTYFQQELARNLDIPLAAVQRELKRLVAADLVRIEHTAGRRIFAANKSSAIYPELASMILKLRGVVPQLKGAVRGADAAWVFGSFASGTAGAVSDVDLMVVGTIKPRDVRERLGRIETKIDRSVNEHVIEPDEWTQRLVRRDSFLTNVRRGPKLWVVGDEAELVRLDPPR